MVSFILAADYNADHFSRLAVLTQGVPALKSHPLNKGSSAFLHLLAEFFFFTSAARFWIRMSQMFLVHI